MVGRRRPPFFLTLNFYLQDGSQRADEYRWLLQERGDASNMCVFLNRGFVLPLPTLPLLALAVIWCEPITIIVKTMRYDGLL